MRILFTYLFILYSIASFSANLGKQAKGNEKDSLKVYYLDEVVINTSVKETNDLRNMPTAISVLSPKQLSNSQVESLPSLSAMIPNFFVPSYGSRVSTPIYIRGIGTRLGSQTVSMYVDNVPSFNPSAFDFEFQDIQRVEVMRGAQGTLYGRNAIGGIVNVYTLSPLSYQGTNVAVSGGNYGQFTAKAATYNKLSDNIGFSINGYFKKDDGYFINNFTGKNADASQNGGGRIKLEWQINPVLQALLFSHYDYVSQGAFPYMHEDSTAVNLNEPSSYDRLLLTNGLSLRYIGNKFSVNSTTGYQFLKDDMKMDQDYSPLSIFSIRQQQKQHSISQEITIKSENNKRYRWVVGAFGFYDNRNINTPVTIKKDGTPFILHRLAALQQMFPQMPEITLKNEEIRMPGKYKKPTYGAALFQQSSINNLFGVEGLSTTFGLRLDYEHAQIGYNTATEGVTMVVKPQMPPNVPPVQIDVPADTTLLGSFKKHFVELLPKFAIRYQPIETAFVYISASKGYKTGGYNEQAFSQILRDAMQKSLMSKIPEGVIPDGIMHGMPSGQDLTLEEQLSYEPEKSWTFELGGRCEMFNRKLSATFALFYTNVNNIQIIKLLEEGTAGRIVTNAGKSASKGAELSLRYTPSNNFTLFGEYGFADARFKNYEVSDSINYSGNYIPFAPQHTLSVGATYLHNFIRNAFIDRIVASVQYSGAGKIYWTEENDVFQPFYALTNASISIEKGDFGLEFWGKNIFNTKYNSFFFKASNMGGKTNAFVQRGYPARIGVTLRYSFNR